MCDPIQSIATRLRGLREALELTQEEVAASCNLPVGQYREMESGTADFSVNVLQTISRHYGISLDVLMFGEEPKMNSYYITRKGSGETVERRDWYKYQSLAAGFSNRKMEPFLVTVQPNPTAEVHLSSHDGQEFNYVEQGVMELHIDGKIMTLNAGDTIMFDARRPHGMRSVGDKELKFVAVII